MTKQKRFYVLPIWEKTLATMEEILKRENKTLSEWIRGAITDYVKLHEPGNPQQRLDTIMDVGHAFRSDACCICSKKPEIEAFTEKGLGLLYCRKCFGETGRSRTVGHRAIKFKKD